jgi:hypothetical protein
MEAVVKPPRTDSRRPPIAAARPGAGSKRRKLICDAYTSDAHSRCHLRIISNRLCVALGALLAVMIVGAYLVSGGHGDSVGATSWMVLLTGILGGFIGLQRRLKAMEHDDLLLLARSWVYILLSPLVGGVLALLLYILFISGLVEGDLFPRFAADAPAAGDGAIPREQAAAGAEARNVEDGTSGREQGLMTLIRIHAVGFEDYAKLLFWCFLAGYSEKFVTNIISRFESTQPSARDGA